MAEDVTFHEIDDIFSDVGCEVRDAFEVPRCAEQSEDGFGVFGVFPNERNGAFSSISFHAVDGLIHFADVTSLLAVEVDECVECLPDHGFGAARHLVQIEGEREFGAVGERHGFACDIDRKIADSFQIVVDFENGDDEAEVSRHGLMQCKYLQALFFDIDFDSIDLGVLVDDHLSLITVAVV